MVESGGRVVGGSWSGQSLILLGARPLQTLPSALGCLGLTASGCMLLGLPPDMQQLPVDCLIFPYYWVASDLSASVKVKAE